MLYLIIPIVIVVFIGIGLLLWLKSLKENVVKPARQQYPDALLQTEALFMGVESNGIWQMSGNGLLVMTHDSLHFTRYAAKREIHIPLKNIESLETPRSFRGKSKGRPLLKINFRNDEGQSDAMGLWVPNLASVKQAISERLS